MENEIENKIATFLASLDASIAPLFPVTDDTENAFNKMMQQVPEEHRQAVTVQYMELQNTIFVKLGKMARDIMGAGMNEELLAPNSLKALDLYKAYLDEKNPTVDSGEE